MKSTQPYRTVATLLEHLGRKGLRIRSVVLDSGFDSGETILLSQNLGLSYTVPLRRKGKGLNRRTACFPQEIQLSALANRNNRNVNSEAYPAASHAFRVENSVVKGLQVIDCPGTILSSTSHTYFAR